MNSPVHAKPPRNRASLPQLDAKQLGHVRHMHNLAHLPSNDWSLMQGRGIDQEDFGGAYRFQLAYMAYALALAHFHRLPAAPGVFRPAFKRLIERMLEPPVWLYWRDISRGGSMFNEHLAHNMQEQWDPVARDNIMYSAYLQSMTLMYNHLFQDDCFTAPGALTFKYWSFFWGGKERRYEYDQNSLNEHLYWKMVESGYLGIACEPNCVFQICNQPAIIGFRYHDLLTGASRAQEVTEAYEKTWLEYGRLAEDGHFNTLILEDSKTIIPNGMKSPWVDAWLGALMNSWNRDYVHAQYERQLADYLERDCDGETALKVQPVLTFGDQSSEADWGDYGWTAAWASEMGDAAMLAKLLDNADRWMRPSWKDGGLYYPRNDRHKNEQGKVTLCDPLTGNVLLGYARLNVADGLWKMYNQPWDEKHFKAPTLSTVAPNLDVTRACYLDDEKTLVFDMQRRREGEHGDAAVRISNVWNRGRWTLRVNGQTASEGDDRDVTRNGNVDVHREGDDLLVACSYWENTAFELAWA